MSFVVITDTSANIPTELAQIKKIQIMEFPCYLDGKPYHYKDTAAFRAEEYYTAIKKGAVGTTSQIRPQDYMEFFEPWLKQGSDIICLTMASGISGTCNSANIAAKELQEQYPERRIEIIDSLSASLGTGLIALAAADLREEGLATEEAAVRLRETVQRVFSIFTVDDLMHLKRGGRISNLSAVIGMVLQIKPILKGSEEGKIVAFAKVRGRKQSIMTLAQMYDKLVKDPDKQTVGIAHAFCREDAEMLADLVRKNKPPREILFVDYEPSTGAHVGPGGLALFFEGEEGIRTYNGESITKVVRQAVTKAGERLPHFKGSASSESS